MPIAGIARIRWMIDDGDWKQDRRQRGLLSSPNAHAFPIHHLLFVLRCSRYSPETPSLLITGTVVAFPLSSTKVPGSDDGCSSSLPHANTQQAILYILHAHIGLQCIQGCFSID